jgi:NADH-quinone oxidoreductase subunit E
MVQINDDYYEDLTPQRLAEIIDELKAGRDVPVGPQTGRHCSAPVKGPKTLTEVPARTGNGAEQG